MTEVWPCHIAPEPGELLSSWIVRFAVQNALTPQLLFQKIQRGVSRASDIDIGPSDDLLRELSLRAGQSVATLRALSLDAYEGLLFEENQRQQSLPWILPLAPSYRKRMRPGLQFCPECLSGKTAYYRKVWRLAFSVVCHEHKVALSDRCACGSPVSLSPVRGWKGLRFCYRCGADLRRSVTFVNRFTYILGALTLQNKCYAALETGRFHLSSDVSVGASEFFRGLRALLKLLIHGTNSALLRLEMPSWKRPDDYEPAFVRGRTAYESMGSYDRLLLANMVSTWLDDWPRAFYARKLGFSSGQWHELKPELDFLERTNIIVPAAGHYS